MQNNLKVLYGLMTGYYLFSAFRGYQDNNMAEVFSSLILATMFFVMLVEIAIKIRVSILVVLFSILIGTMFF